MLFLDLDVTVYIYIKLSKSFKNEILNFKLKCSEQIKETIVF